MRGIRAIINAVLVATLLKPMLRRSVARWRKEARASAEATIVIPARELLSAQLAPEASGPQLMSDEAADVAGRSILGTVLVLGAVAALAVASALAIAALRRRRRSAITREPEVRKELVAVPVEVPAEESEAVETLGVASPSPR